MPKEPVSLSSSFPSPPGRSPGAKPPARLPEPAPSSSQSAEKSSTSARRLDLGKLAVKNTATTAIHSAETLGTTFACSMAEGLFGPDKLKIGGIDLRAPIGLASAGYGFYTILSAERGGEHAVAIGNGTLGSLLASIGRDAGIALRERRAGNTQGAAPTPQPAAGFRGEEPLVRVPHDLDGSETQIILGYQPAQEAMRQRLLPPPQPPLPALPPGPPVQTQAAPPFQGYAPYPHQGYPQHGYPLPYSHTSPHWQQPVVSGYPPPPPQTQAPGYEYQGYQAHHFQPPQPPPPVPYGPPSGPQSAYPPGPPGPYPGHAQVAGYPQTSYGAAPAPYPQTSRPRPAAPPPQSAHFGPERILMLSPETPLPAPAVNTQRFELGLTPTGEEESAFQGASVLFTPVSQRPAQQVAHPAPAPQPHAPAPARTPPPEDDPDAFAGPHDRARFRQEQRQERRERRQEALQQLSQGRFPQERFPQHSPSSELEAQVAPSPQSASYRAA